MKKLFLSIFVLSLLLSGNAIGEIIYRNCDLTPNYEPGSIVSIDLDNAIQNQRSMFLMFVEDCKITEGFGNDYSSGGSPLNTYDIDC